MNEGLAKWLHGQESPDHVRAVDGYQDQGLDLLLEHLGNGYVAVDVVLARHNLGPLPAPFLMFTVDRQGERQTLLVWVGARTLAAIETTLAETPVTDTATSGLAGEPEPAPDLPSELRELLAELQKRVANEKERANALADFMLDKLEGSRCALVQYEHDGAKQKLLAFRRRGPASSGSIDVKRIPSQILAHVARTRQPLISHDVEDPANELAYEATILHQRIKSYIAVPVVFRGDLLGVSYIDRFDPAVKSPRRFEPHEQRAFEALSYELALPLVELVEERCRRELRARVDELLNGDDAVASPAFAPVLEHARQLGPFRDARVLVLGETGSGKEFLARYIHAHSPQAGKPFVAVNVSGITAELFESELMGSVRGAFTGAVDRPGRIVEAEHGSLFLDEIGDLTLPN